LSKITADTIVTFEIAFVPHARKQYRLMVDYEMCPEADWKLHLLLSYISLVIVAKIMIMV